MGAPHHLSANTSLLFAAAGGGCQSVVRCGVLCRPSSYGSAGTLHMLRCSWGSSAIESAGGCAVLKEHAGQYVVLPAPNSEKQCMGMSISFFIYSHMSSFPLHAFRYASVRTCAPVLPSLTCRWPALTSTHVSTSMNTHCVSTAGSSLGTACLCFTHGNACS